MDVFLSTLNQSGFLFLLILIGYLLAKFGVVPRSSAGMLAKLENFVFVPAIIIGTFVRDFTFEKLSSAWSLMAVCAGIMVVTTLIAIIVPILLEKPGYRRNIYTYSLAFSNFGFMGYAIIGEFFPDLFLQYTLFCLPIWFLLYLWGIPILLIPKSEGGASILSRLKPFVNPMVITLIIGMILGLCGAVLPTWVESAVDSAKACLSPVAMILTGISISTISIKKAFTSPKIYIVSLLRLVAIPLLFILVAKLIPFGEIEYLLAVCTLAMPFGLNTIIMPEAYGQDAELGAGLTLVSSVLACITIPLMLTIM